jgi:uncharacterized protein involved in response to NO
MIGAPDRASQFPTSALERFRSEPFRIFFPLAFLLGALGVSHWALLSTGVLGRYLAVFHAVTQMQSFLLAFASGFLLTAIPKRTRSAPASWAEIGALVVLLPTVSLATLVGANDLGQLCYVGALLVLAEFAIRRFANRAAGRRPPTSFVLVPLGLFAGLAGAIMLVAADFVPAASWVYPLGRALVLEGVFLCLALGVGPFFLAVALHGEAPPDISRSTARAIVGYASAGAILLGSLVLHASGFVRAGLILRGGTAAAVLCAGGAWHRPSRPGYNRQLLWLATWMLPAGLIVAAVFPEHRVAAMHVTFIGGFGLLAFSVSTHVTLGHSGNSKDQAGRPRAVAWFGALFAVAMLIRSVGTVVSSHYFEWLGVSAVIWLAAACVWALYLLPKMWGKPLADEPAEAP